MEEIDLVVIALEATFQPLFNLLFIKPLLQAKDVVLAEPFSRESPEIKSILVRILLSFTLIVINVSTFHIYEDIYIKPYVQEWIEIEVFNINKWI